MAVAQHYYSNGDPVPLDDYPKHMSSEFIRKLYRRGKDKIKVNGSGDSASVTTSMNIYRAQAPHIVTLPIMASEFAVEPEFREYFVYAPNGEPGRAGYFAMNLWKKWERIDKGIPVDQDFPRVDHVQGEVAGMICEQIDDGDFDETWKAVRQRKHKAAGDPEHPFAFTCLDKDFRIYKTGDPASGIVY